MLFHVRIDTPPWGPDAALQMLDRTLEGAGSTPLDIDMAKLPLEPDGDHFTRAGQRRFSEEVVRDLAGRTRGTLEHVLVLADSTVDFHNWTEDGEWTGWATVELVEAFARRNVRAIVDGVCGSGFVARAREGEHFYARLSQHLRHDGYRGPVLLIGGWNDVRARRAHDAAQAIRMCATTLERFNGIR